MPYGGSFDLMTGDLMGMMWLRLVEKNPHLKDIQDNNCIHTLLTTSTKEQLIYVLRFYKYDEIASNIENDEKEKNTIIINNDKEKILKEIEREIM